MRITSPTSQIVARALLICCLALPTAACASVDPVVKVALVGPFEGRYRDVGYDAIYSARLAVREINRAGGINGHRVALVALDDGGDPELASQAAASLVVDPGVVAVAGHFLAETTAAAAPIYDSAGLALLPMGEPPFAAGDPAQLPGDFLDAYASVSPFDEVAGPYAGTTYDAFQLLLHALAKAEESGSITRSSVQAALTDLEYEGLMGTVFQP